MLEAIRKGATRHLRAVDPRLSGDLDTVLGKALQLDHERRYSSAAEMRADLQRWLRDEPIIARPPSVPYQIRKFAKRNKALVGGIVGIFLVLVAGLAAERARRLQALAAEHRAQAAQAKVEVEAQRSQRVIQFLNDMLQSVTPDQANGQEVTVRQVLDEVATGLDEELQDSPEVDATVRYILGETYEQLGAYREAVAMLKAAAAIHERLGIATEETAHIHHSLGSCHVHLKELDDALTEYGVALSLAEKLLGPESDAFLQILNDRGQVYYERNDLEEVAATLRQVIAIRERAFGESDQDLHIVRVNLAMVLQQQGKRPEARDLLRNAFNWLVEHNGPTQSSTLGVMERLAGAEYELGNTAEADRLSLEMIALFREHFGPDHPELALALLSYGSRLQNTYREAEAEEALRESLRIREVAFGPNHVDTAAVLGRLGAAVAEQDRLDEGLALQERALQIYRSAVEARDVPLAWALHGYAAILSKAERYNDALAASEEAIDLLAKAYGGEAPQTLIAKARMAMTELTMGKRLEALALHEEILRERQRQLQENHPDITMAMCNLASNQLELNRFQEARELFDDVVPRFRVELGEQAVNYCMALTRAALTAFYDGDADAAIASATSALGCPEFQRKSDARLGVLARAIVAQAHLHRDELAEAQTVFAEMQPPPATLMQETRWESGYALLVDAKLLQAAGADPVPTATRAYEILNRKFGPEHLFTRTAAELAQP
jgi:tetratricopeptide (TPR) repeat protein